MKTLLTIAVLALLCGCASWKSATHKTTGTVVVTADTAMKGWAAYVATGKATPAQEATVRDCYGKYQAAMNALIDVAASATAGGNRPALELITATAAAALADLLNVISQFVPQTK